MPSLKSIRKRIVSVKSTQKITRAMKMVAGARLARAQQRIVALRPYAVKTQEVLAAVLAAQASEDDEGAGSKPPHPLLVRRPERRVLYLLLTSDRGLCGSFNTNLNKGAERSWRDDLAAGREPTFFVVGRKGNDFLRRRSAPVGHAFRGVWESTDHAQARLIASTLLAPFRAGEVDAIKIIYNQFRSAMSQTLVVEQLLPVVARAPEAGGPDGHREPAAAPTEYLYEPDPAALLDRLVPMYLEISILRALYESQASEFGARMTAMDSATKNAKEMISSLTLQYNRARQAAITKELMEIIGGAEALKE
ncbi:MAG TPA: ATP synthase F1 subunit gamma [Polyangiaceae bacterium]|nr:ATP synthase F1 subunit gamma [Polyangiaceae bacterium]